jgi:hypothetical protein
MAKAEGVAQIIAAKAGIEITNLQERAIARWLHEEERKQENLETIIKGSIPHLAEDSEPQDIDDDWLMSFLDFAKKVSDKDLQFLWSKILAGKANRPGKYRKNLLQCVYVLEKVDADLFVTLCQFAIDLEVMTILLFNPNHEIYTRAGLKVHAILHLTDLGLMQHSSLQGFSKSELPQAFQIYYGGQRFSVQLPDGKSELPVGMAILSDVGQQLATLANAPAVPGFPEYFMEEWGKEGIKVSKL